MEPHNFVTTVKGQVTYSPYFTVRSSRVLDPFRPQAPTNPIVSRLPRHLPRPLWPVDLQKPFSIIHITPRKLPRETRIPSCLALPDIERAGEASRSLMVQNIS